MLPNPAPYIAPFALLLATFIIIISAIFYVRKKILEESKNWRGIPTILGVIALVVLGALFYMSIFVSFFLTPFILIILGIPLILAEARYRIKLRERLDYPSITIEVNWSLTAGIVGPILILIGASIVLFYGISRLIGTFLFFQLTYILTFLWGLLALIGLFVGIKAKRIGSFICLIAGVLSTFGMYIPIGTLYGFWPVYLSSSVFYFEPYLMLIGGIIGVISKDDFLEYFVVKREYRKKFSDIMEEMDKIDDLKTFLKEKLSSDWEKIKISFEAYKAGEIEKGTFIKTALKNIGNKFIEIFTEQKRENLNEA